MSIEGNTLKVDKIILTKPSTVGEHIASPNNLLYGQIAYESESIEGNNSNGKLFVGRATGSSGAPASTFSSDLTTRTSFSYEQIQESTNTSRLYIDAGTHNNNFNIDHDNKLYVTTNRSYNSSLADNKKRFARICIDRAELENESNYAIFGVGVVDGNNVFTYKGAIFANGSAIFQDLSYTNIAQTSDKSKKKSIYNLNDSYDKLFDELKPKRYKWKEKSWGENQMLGFIANDIKESLDKNNIDDQSIILGEEGNYSFSSTQIIPLNTWQIQKLKKRVSDLEERLAKLENRE